MLVLLGKETDNYLVSTRAVNSLQNVGFHLLAVLRFVWWLCLFVSHKPRLNRLYFSFTTDFLYTNVIFGPLQFLTPGKWDLLSAPLSQCVSS